MTKELVFFDQIKQVIFEENTATGISLVSVSRAATILLRVCEDSIRAAARQGCVCVRAGRQ